MSQEKISSIIVKWEGWSPYILSLVRIVAAFMFMTAGTMKLFAYPVGITPDGGAVELFSLIGVAGVLEVFGGALLLLGLFTRPVAFLLSGQMAFAYFIGHAGSGFWPTLNGGQPAVLYCFLWLYLSSAGGGAWSLDKKLRGK
jgi:putative oxidoreductase